MREPSRSPRAGAGDRGARFADLGPRIGSAAALIATALVALYVGGDAFALFWLLAGFAVSWEWQSIVGGEMALARFALGGASLAAATAFAAHGGGPAALASLAAFSAILAILAGPGRRLWAPAGLLYAGSLIVSTNVLRHSPDYGAISIAWLFAVVWGTDVMAYFGGRLIGGAKLWPRVSPGKTWSGTLVGVASGALLGLCVVYLSRWSAAATLPLFFVGLVAAALAQAGDLFESWIKRRFGVKDSSRLIPGHGGVMDRVDGFIFASAFAAMLGGLRGQESLAAGIFIW
ncbi:CDP-archaeol synthase [Methylosinus sporium]|uniref:Phosphatidate cytidylyltransferase n=1 Tax=Methylosinus sporium TaxID=428 RepID=A0A549T3T1_METSR|nr:MULTISPECIES: CDP-archaeol synthase [Methylosinus]MBU3886843.1 phosphatidate cytidylyltransferase [Methylosinus sp. KRF6]TRL36555.1 CDP-archaeol synthase [Methylosinus sporium]